MPTVTNFVRGSNPVWYFVNNLGDQFDDTYWMYVLENEVPYIPTPVYHDLLGTIPWTDPIQFLANGTLPTDIFFDKDKVYRLEFRKNIPPTPPSQGDQLIYVVPDYLPVGGIPDEENNSTTTGNQISNGQFVDYNGDTIRVSGITNPAPIEVAPDWFLELVGNGTVEIERIPLDSTLPTPTNAPYAIHITLSGSWTQLPVLRQRFQQNGVNWAGKYLSTSLTGLKTGTSAQIMVRLDASNGQPLETLLTTFLTNDFTQYNGFKQIPAYVNNDVPPDAYIDYKLFLPVSGEFYFTSFQLIASDVAENLDYEQETPQRQLDHLFHFYKPLLEYKPIESYLIGWDFPMNPAQALTSAVPVQAVGAAKSYYAWDQTIIFQQIDSGVEIARDTVTQGIKIIAKQDGRIAFLQYLPMQQARELLRSPMSVYLSGITNNPLLGTVTIWATDDTNLPDLTTNDSAVTALSATGYPTMGNGNWTEVTRTNQTDATFEILDTKTTKMINGWDFAVDPLVSTAKFMAIVIGFETMTTNDYVIFDCVSLNAGSIATRPAPKTFAETLLQCQEFYFKTFDNDTLPAQNVGADTGHITWSANGAGNTFSNSYGYTYPVEMRAIPDIVTYSPSSASDQIYCVGRGPLTATSIFYSSRKNFYVQGLGNAGTLVGDLLIVHVTADARLGIVN